MHGGGGGGSGGPPPPIALTSPTCPAMATARASRIGGRCHPGPRVRRHCPTIPIVAVSVGLVALLAGTRGGGLCCCSSISPRCSLGAVAREAHAPTAGTKPLPPPASNGCVRHAPLGRGYEDMRRQQHTEQLGERQAASRSRASRAAMDAAGASRIAGRSAAAGGARGRAQWRLGDDCKSALLATAIQLAVRYARPCLALAACHSWLVLR
jgi:hypothetical protein